MVGQIPGLLKLEANAPLASTAHRSQGYNMGLVAILEKAEDVKVYAEHPAHLAYVLSLSHPISVPSISPLSAHFPPFTPSYAMSVLVASSSKLVCVTLHSMRG